MEMPFNLKIGEYTLYGVIDRIDETGEGGARIIDYKIYIILENARVPPAPINFIISLALARVTQTMSIFITKETKVEAMPKLSSIIKVVVKTAGPVIKGVPKGKTPTSLSWPFEKTILDVPGSRSRTEITNKSMPPAIWKSAMTPLPDYLFPD